MKMTAAANHKMDKGVRLKESKEPGWYSLWKSQAVTPSPMAIGTRIFHDLRLPSAASWVGCFGDMGWNWIAPGEALFRN